MARRITLVDLTDPVLNSTRLDSAIMDIAVHDFLRHSAERKMIILTNCQQYLMPTSTLRKTIESLATAGSGRTTSVILSTTDPTAISASPSFIHSLQYVLFGSSYSILHNGFLDKHFPHLPIPHEQCGFRRAVLWSPGSTLYLPKNEVPAKKSWNSLVSFIDVAEFEDFTPTAVLPNGTHNKIPDQQEPNHVEPVPHVTRLDSDDDGETSMSLGTPVPSNNELTSPAPSNEPLSQLTPTRPKAPPSQAPSSPPAENTTSSNKFEPLITAVLHLCEGELGILVDFEAVRKQVGRREEIQKLGWTTFTQYVKAACEKGLLEFTETGPNTKFLSLLAIETPAPVRWVSQYRRIAKYL
ncbi:hypothetical protein M408DRAFT_229464 [Serendipita vermifera MAFF 305830]|uniref:Uncharacterized protein n=1 Tax=Serendipita vermifera MAFF 305830 TaxID=933852 RepID=A0A0C3AZW4_SERVB|nr:hypothetical protein M408DRAFT_229464 [Serendipita vermifera MAFF 305830]